MTLTQKETTLLSDLKSQEQLCIEKYTKYAEQACDPTLKNLFTTVKSTEENHLSTICRIMNGEEVSMGASSSGSSSSVSQSTQSTCPQQSKDHDAFLCKDALSMEKHVSSLYDTCIFEFSSPVLRNTLNHIQKEEQQHGEELYRYMKNNNMYS